MSSAIQVYGSGNYSVTMKAFDDIVDGYISTFYLYSENLTYADHDEIDFEFRSGAPYAGYPYGSYDTTQKIWTNIYHTTDVYPYGNGYDVDMTAFDALGGDSFSLQDEHTYRFEVVLGDFVKWWVDDVLIREEVASGGCVPTHKMAIRLSIWKMDDCSWCGSFDASNAPQEIKYNTALFTFDEMENNRNCDTSHDPIVCHCDDFAFNGDCS